MRGCYGYPLVGMSDTNLELARETADVAIGIGTSLSALGFIQVFGAVALGVGVALRANAKKR